MVYHITSSILPDFSCNCSGHVHVELTQLHRQHPLSSKRCAWSLPFLLRASSEPLGKAGQKFRMLIPVGMMLHQWRCWIYCWTFGEPFFWEAQLLRSPGRSESLWPTAGTLIIVFMLACLTPLLHIIIFEINYLAPVTFGGNLN